MDTAPRAAAIIVAYQQPGLLGEAILSVLRQSEPFVAVVVDDGCPMEETREVGLCFARAYPGRICYLRRPRQGLSAARNAGASFALKAWPQLQAVMFLDAEDRIEPRFFARALEALAEAPAEIGWVYPDLDPIGPGESSSMRGPFSRVALLDGAYACAGAVLRPALLDAGPRFDETLGAGAADWDFWLQATDAGFRGQYLPNAGLRRRKPGHPRDADLAALRSKRAAWFRPRNLLALEAREAPRFGIVTEAGGFVRFVCDPAAPGKDVPFDKAVAALRRAESRPGAAHAPPLFCFASSTALLSLRESLALANMFWLAQVLLRASPAVAIFVKAGAGERLRMRIGERPDHGDPAMMFVPSSHLLKAAGAPGATPVTVEIPETISAETLAADASGAMDAFIACLRATPPPPREDWRPDFRPARADLIALYRRICDAGVPLPLPPDLKARGEIGFLIPPNEPDIQIVCANQARALRGLGYRAHLFIYGGDSFDFTQEIEQSFCSVNLLPDPGQTDADVRGLLCGLDVLIAGAGLLPRHVLARLRQWGLRIVFAIQETDLAGLASGGECDRVLVSSRNLRNACLAHGAPRETILLVPNAPGYPSCGDAEFVRENRAARTAGPLRALYLGRLGHEKGAERLAAIMAATRGRIAWRVAGEADGAVVSGIDVEPAPKDFDERDALYDWADVLVWPMPVEGAPLTLPEARRRGVVVIASQVGAIHVGVIPEIIGAGGYPIEAGRDERAIVTDFVAKLVALAKDPALLAARAAAVLSDPPPTWLETMAPLIADLESADRLAEAAE
jgi:hypothetical protein